MDRHAREGERPLAARELSRVQRHAGQPAGECREAVAVLGRRHWLRRRPRVWRARHAQAAGTSRDSVSRSTRPAVPSIAMVLPSGIRRVAPGTPSTAGMPHLRQITAACDSRPPVSVTTPAARSSSTVHPGSVNRQTRIAPFSRPIASSTAWATRATPRTAPGSPVCRSARLRPRVRRT